MKRYPQDQHTYTPDEIGNILARLWCGAAYKETVAAEGMPRAKRNPAQLATDWAAEADVSRALDACLPRLHIHQLWLRWGSAMEAHEVADWLQLPYEDTVNVLEQDMEALVGWCNGHLS